MTKFLHYIGSDHILGEVVGETVNGLYWKVLQTPDKKNPGPAKMVCHPKWSTEVIQEDDLLCNQYMRQ